MAEKVTGPASYFPSIEKKYGRPIAEWKALIRGSELTKHGELVTWLKTEHGLGHGRSPGSYRVRSWSGQAAACSSTSGSVTATRLLDRVASRWSRGGTPLISSVEVP